VRTTLRSLLTFLRSAQELLKVIKAIINDLNMYMWGSSIGKGDNDLPYLYDPNSPSAIKVAPRIQPWPYDALNGESLDDVPPMRSQPGQESSMEKGRKIIDCGKFKKDLKDVGIPPSLPLKIR